MLSPSSTAVSHWQYTDSIVKPLEEVRLYRVIQNALATTENDDRRQREDAYLHTLLPS